MAQLIGCITVSEAHFYFGAVLFGIHALCYLLLLWKAGKWPYFGVPLATHHLIMWTMFSAEDHLPRCGSDFLILLFLMGPWLITSFVVSLYLDKYLGKYWTFPGRGKLALAFSALLMAPGAGMVFSVGWVLSSIGSKGLLGIDDISVLGKRVSPACRDRAYAKAIMYIVFLEALTWSLFVRLVPV